MKTFDDKKGASEGTLDGPKVGASEGDTVGGREGLIGGERMGLWVWFWCGGGCGSRWVELKGRLWGCW